MILKILLLIFSLFAAILGYKKKLVDKQSLAFMTIFLFYFIFLFPLKFFVPVLILYMITGVATKYKTDKKKVYHKKGRTVNNLLSNLLIAIIFSLMYLIYPIQVFYLAFLCSLACASADTLASEIGQLSMKNPRLITTLEEVKTGTDGGISLLGSLFGLLGALAVSLPAYYLGLYKVLIVALIGFIGCNIDSIIGANIELKGRCTNETTNLYATLSAGILGLLSFSLLI